MSGKSVAKALRGHFLVEAVLTTKLLKITGPTQGSGKQLCTAIETTNDGKLLSTADKTMQESMPSRTDEEIKSDVRLVFNLYKEMQDTTEFIDLRSN